MSRHSSSLRSLACSSDATPGDLSVYLYPEYPLHLEPSYDFKPGVSAVAKFDIPCPGGGGAGADTDYCAINGLCISPDFNIWNGKNGCDYLPNEMSKAYSSESLGYWLKEDGQSTCSAEEVKWGYGQTGGTYFYYEACCDASEYSWETMSSIVDVYNKCFKHQVRQRVVLASLRIPF